MLSSATSECVFLWELLEAACSRRAPRSKPILAGRTDATASYQEFQETLKEARGEGARRASLEALLAGLGEAGCEQPCRGCRTGRVSVTRIIYVACCM